jgi:hypothetical protein
MSGGSKKLNEDDMILRYIEFFEVRGKAPTPADLEAEGLSKDMIADNFGSWASFVDTCEERYNYLEPTRVTKMKFSDALGAETPEEAPVAAPDWGGKDDDPFMTAFDESPTKVVRAESIQGPYRSGTTRPLGAVLSTASPETRKEVLAAGGFVIPAPEKDKEEADEGKPRIPTIQGLRSVTPGAEKPADSPIEKKGARATLQGRVPAVDQTLPLASKEETAEVPAPEAHDPDKTVVRKTITLAGVPITPPVPPVPEPDTELTTDDIVGDHKDVYLGHKHLAAMVAAGPRRPPQVSEENDVDRNRVLDALAEAIATSAKKAGPEVTRVAPIPVIQQAIASGKIESAPQADPSSETIPAPQVDSSSATVPFPESVNLAAATGGSLFEDDADEDYDEMTKELPEEPASGELLAKGSVVVDPAMGAYDAPLPKPGVVAVPIASEQEGKRDKIEEIIERTIEEKQAEPIAVAEPGAGQAKTGTEVLPPAAAEHYVKPEAAAVDEKVRADAPDYTSEPDERTEVITRSPLSLLYSKMKKWSAARAEVREEKNAEKLKQKLEQQAQERPAASGSHTLRNIFFGGLTALALAAGAIGIGGYFGSKNNGHEQYNQSRAAVVDAGAESYDAGLDSMIAMNQHDAGRVDSLQAPVDAGRVDASAPDSGDDYAAPLVPTPDSHDDHVAPVPEHDDTDSTPAVTPEGGCTLRLGMEFDSTDYVDSGSSSSLESYVLAQYADGQREFFVYGFASIEDHGRAVHDDNVYNTRLALRRALKAKADLLSIIARNGLGGVSVSDAVSWSELEVFAPGVSPEDRGVLVSTTAVDDPETDAALARVLSSYAAGVPQGPGCGPDDNDGSSGSDGSGSGVDSGDGASGLNMRNLPAGVERPEVTADAAESRLTPDEIPIFPDYLMNPGSDMPVYTDVSLNDLGLFDESQADAEDILPDDFTIVRQVVREYKRCVFGSAYSKSEFSVRFRQRFGYDCDLATAKAMTSQDYSGSVDSMLIEAVREMNSSGAANEAVRTGDEPAVQRESMYSRSQLEDMRDIYVYFYGKAFDQQRFEELMSLFGLGSRSWDEVSVVSRQVLEGNMNPVYQGQSDYLELTIDVEEPELDITVTEPMTETQLALDEVLAQLSDLQMNAGPTAKSLCTEEQARTVYELSQQGFTFEDIRRIVRVSGLDLTQDNYSTIRSIGMINSLAEPRQNAVDGALAEIIPGYAPKQHEEDDYLSIEIDVEEQVIELGGDDALELDADGDVVLGDADIEIVEDVQEMPASAYVKRSVPPPIPQAAQYRNSPSHDTQAAFAEIFAFEKERVERRDAASSSAELDVAIDDITRCLEEIAGYENERQQQSFAHAKAARLASFEQRYSV